MTGNKIAQQQILYMIYATKFVTGILFLVFSFPLSAAESSSLQFVSESDFFSEIPSIVSATRLPQPRSETPAAVTIIDSEMIKASGVRTISELFRLVPGFQVGSRRGVAPAVTYHGLSDRYARRMQVLVDGRSVYGAWQRSVIWVHLNLSLDDIDRIEVIRGPNTASYGANAFFATINIITKHSEQTTGSLVKSATGNHDIKDITARYGTNFDLGSIRFSYNYLADDGIDQLADSYRVRSFNLRSDLKLSDSDELMLQYGIGKQNQLVGFGNFLFPDDREGYTQNHFEHIEWKRSISDNNQITAKFSHNQQNIHTVYDSDPLTLPAPFGTIIIPVNITGTEHRYDLEIQNTLTPWDDWRIVWGLGASEDNVRSENFFSTPDTFTNKSSRLFNSTEWKPTEQLVLNMGLMLEETDLTGTDLSPRLAVNYHLNHAHTLRAAWSEAIRTPSLYEEYGDLRLNYLNFLINHFVNNEGGLKPEDLTTYEIGYLGQIADINTSIDIRLYRNELTNFINPVYIASPDLTDNLAVNYQNNGEVTIDGLDLEFIFRPLTGTRIILTNSWMNATVEGISTSSAYSKEQIESSVPNYSGSLFIMHDLGNSWKASFGYYWVGKMLWMRDLPNTNDQPVNSYTRFDFRLGSTFKMHGLRSELAFVVQNAGDDYQEFTPNQVTSTRRFITFQVEF